jgi:NADH:ubiquinone oxidoreductase subunit K
VRRIIQRAYTAVQTTVVVVVEWVRHMQGSMVVVLLMVEAVVEAVVGVVLVQK